MFGAGTELEGSMTHLDHTMRIGGMPNLPARAKTGISQ